MEIPPSERAPNPTNGLSIETFDSKCSRCGGDFKASRATLCGAVLTTRLCNKCAEEFDAENAKSAEQRRQQDLLRNAVAREEAWAQICPVEFRTPNENDGKTSLARLEKHQPAVKELLHWTGPKGLIIRGKTGKCKTRSMWRLMRRLYMEGRRLVVLTPGQFDRQCRDAGGNFTLTEWFNRLSQCDVFVMDDLGKAQWTPATEASWFDLVDERTRYNRPIIATTNDTGQTIAARMSPDRAEMLIRRLRDYCDQIVFQ